jgi:phospholipid-binding lipoprotein MlaA
MPARHITALLLLCLSLFGCATSPQTQRDPRDPFERVNRATFRVNDTLDKYVARPVARTYVRVTPQPVRTGVSNFLDNLAYPVTIGNDLLQLKLRMFGRDLARFVVNSTVGIGGIFDLASGSGLEKNQEDLGLTFGHYGAGPGPYLVIPILGPSDVRDGIGRVGDIWMDPRHYIHSTYVSYGLWVVSAVDLRARLLPTDQTLEGVYDRYSFVRNAYLQRRAYLVSRGRTSRQQQQQQEDQQLEDEKRILQESEGPDQPQARPDSTSAPPPTEPDAPPQPRENEARPQQTPPHF